MRKRLISTILIATLYLLPLFAINENEDIENYYTSVAELNGNAAFIAFIGSTADSVLTRLKDAITPGIIRLSYANASLNTSDNTRNINVSIVGPSSFIGTLLTVLLTLECVILGIKSFLGMNGNFMEIIKHFLLISVVLAFIALLPIIADGILNIFTTMGVIAGGGENTSTYFPFKPSSIINIFGSIKNALDLQRLALTGNMLSKLPYILVFYISLLIIAIPFCIVCVLVIFWYLEFSFIVLIGTVLLPFTVFSYTNITDIKTILKALLLEGVKIFLGVFIATLVGEVIKDTLKNFNTNAGGVLNLIVYLFLMTAVFIFGITKGPATVLNAIGGSVSPSMGGNETSSFLLGGLTAISALKGIKNRNLPQTTEPDTPPEQPLLPVAPKDPPFPPPKEIEDKPIIPKEIIPRTISVHKKHPYMMKYATPKRMEKANDAFRKEGVFNASKKEVEERARWETTYKELKKMEKNGFINKEGNLDKMAKKQFNEMTKERASYLNGSTTWKGDKI